LLDGTKAVLIAKRIKMPSHVALSFINQFVFFAICLLYPGPFSYFSEGSQN